MCSRLVTKTGMFITELLFILSLISSYTSTIEQGILYFVNKEIPRYLISWDFFFNFLSMQCCRFSFFPAKQILIYVVLFWTNLWDVNLVIWSENDRILFKDLMVFRPLIVHREMAMSSQLSTIFTRDSWGNKCWRTPPHFMLFYNCDWWKTWTPIHLILLFL
jgi:hypothetical protein